MEECTRYEESAEDYSSGDSETNSSTTPAKKRNFSELSIDWKLESSDKSEPARKRRKVNLVHTARALEWFYDLLTSSDYSCVSWLGTQGHFVINDSNDFLDGMPDGSNP